VEELGFVHELRLQLLETPRKIHDAVHDCKDVDIFANYVADQHVFTHDIETQP